jgi:hypothetical protein
MNKTDTKEEIEKGRLALWLEPSDIAFICNEWRRLPENLSKTERERWARIAFRGMSALHNEGIEYSPDFPKEKRKYKMTES